MTVFLKSPGGLKLRALLLATVALTSLPGLAAPPPAPPTSCTLLGCMNQLLISISHPPQERRSIGFGEYELIARLDENTYGCKLTFLEEESAATCRFRFSTFKVTIDSFHIELASPGPTYHLIELRIYHQGQQIWGVSDHVARYGDPTHPNGEGCPPTCWRGRSQFWIEQEHNTGLLDSKRSATSTPHVTPTQQQCN